MKLWRRVHWRVDGRERSEGPSLELVRWILEVVVAAAIRAAVVQSCERVEMVGSAGGSTQLGLAGGSRMDRRRG
jgi:hypothetical protein